MIDAWTQAGDTVWNLTALYWKQKQIKSDLKHLNRENFSQIQVRVSEANRLLLDVQVLALNTPSTHLFEMEKQALQTWNFLRGIEESYFRQRSRVNWLKEGDQNTTFFFRMVQARMNFNFIRSFLLPLGVIISDPILMSVHAVTHFQQILGPSPAHVLGVLSTTQWFHSLTDFACPSELAAQMTALPTADEIRSVMFKLNQNKAPGPDGLTSGFYKASWNILGGEVTESIRHFFISSFMPASTNATILSLIPKHPGASLITEYRPISCLNTIYKVVSRLLVKRLKPILADLIVPNQTAFVKGRLLVENTSLAGELVQGYHKNTEPKRITIKVDIAKAFDTLSWPFLFSCLQAIDVPTQLLRWLRACICHTNFTVGYNGYVNGYFKGTRGLRQGDPLSPYLFVIAMNVLSFMLNQAARDMKFNYHQKCEGSKLTHLCFADDLLIFIDGSLSSVQAVLQVLREFELRSGLAVSVQKSSFFASGLSTAETDLIQFSTGMPMGALPVRYLGVPLCTKKLSMLHCEVLMQQIKSRLSSWSAKSLSFAGRLLLIKTVITGIMTFWCSTFILPQACVKRINSLCGVFLWKGDIEEHHSARVSWDLVTKPKREGGLGIKNFKVWNKACCLKLIWLLFFQAGSVWVAWFKEEVLDGCLSNLWIIAPSRRFSWQVNKLLKLSQSLYGWIKLRVENGRSCRFWTDNWSPYGDLRSYLGINGDSGLGIPLDATLASLHRGNHWRIPPARSENLVNIHVLLTATTLTDSQDYYAWEVDGKKSSTYSTGIVYEQLSDAGTLVSWLYSVWNKGGIPRHNFLAWLFVLNRCPTKDRILGWGLQTSPTCVLCNCFPESRNHLFFDCHYAWSIWGTLASRCGVQPERSWDRVLGQLQAQSRNSLTGTLLRLCWQACIYWTWTERNSRLHQQTFRTPESVSRTLVRQITDRISSLRDSNPAVASSLMQQWLA